MNVKKFVANTSRGAWRQVRDALGPDAVILSNRSVPEGVEILALAQDDIASITAPGCDFAAPDGADPVSPIRVPAITPPFDNHRAAGLAASLEAARQQVQAQPISNGNSVREFAAVMDEIRSMRGMLETQLASLAWTSMQQREPVKAVVMRELLGAGFSASLSRYLTEKMPSSGSDGSAMTWIKSILVRNLAALENENEIMEQGGVYALVGPTGVGKTTTTAKLAARCVMRHGAGKLALITTDGYRIGGYEQLRIYGKILGVMVHSVKDETDLKIALDELKGKHMILIDTVGVSQRDQMVAQQVAMLSGAGSTVKRLLCLNATSTGETLSEVVRAYEGTGLAGCIMTKLDEAATIGSALDAIIRHKLNLYYVANGQRVPEDLHATNRQYLVDRAFKLKRETAAFKLRDVELPLVAANAARAMHDPALREVNVG